jgi:hypothetical protein
LRLVDLGRIRHLYGHTDVGLAGLVLHRLTTGSQDPTCYLDAYQQQQPRHWRLPH